MRIGAFAPDIVHISYLCKRRYMDKDVVLDRYARLYEIPSQLARLGHQVAAYCLAYNPSDKEGHWVHAADPGKLVWSSQQLGFASLAYPQRLLDKLRRSKTDLLIASSDIPHLVLGNWLARRLGVPFVADLYDNFEGFGQARIPGMVSLLRHAVRGADLVLTTSDPLRELVTDVYGARGDVLAMPSTIDKAVFHHRKQSDCRDALGLPQDAILIGTAGGLYRDKGTSVLYEAWAQLRADMPMLHLVLAGPFHTDLPPPVDERVHYLGSLPHAQVAQLFAALDVGVICVLDTMFGRFSFPQKAYEMVAAGLPVVAANVGAMGRLFESVPNALYAAGDSSDLAVKLTRQIIEPAYLDIPILDWKQIISGVEDRLIKLVSG